MSPKVATPLTALTGFVPVRTLVPGLLLRDRVTDAVLSVSTLPKASRTSTVKSEIFEPAGVSAGWVPKASRVPAMSTAVPVLLLTSVVVVIRVLAASTVRSVSPSVLRT